MATDPIPVAYPFTFAHRTGSDVRIVLDLDPSVSVAATAPVLRLTNGQRRVRGEATVSADGERHRIEATVPRRGLTPGTWRLDLRPGPGEPVRRVRARLLVGPDRSVVVLTGRPAKDGIEPPRRTPAADQGRARRAFEAALRPLPEHRAEQVRGLARRAARTVRR